MTGGDTAPRRAPARVAQDRAAALVAGSARPRFGLARAAAFAVVALLVALAALGACSVVGQRVTHVDHQVFDIAAGGHTDLTVATFNGHITVTAMGEGTADVTVTSFGSGPSTDIAQAALDSVNVRISQSVAAMNVTATPSGNGPAGGDRGADVDAILPPNASLTLTTSNGRIEAANVNGSVTATTSNGEIVSRAGHDLHLETSNGTITMSQPAGTVVAHTSNAAVDILNADGMVADVESSSGAISFSGSLGGGDQLFRTSNGSLDLRLPAGQGFSIAARSSNASVTTDFAGVIVNGASLSGTVGDGSARITAETSNGALSVLRLTP